MLGAMRRAVAMTVAVFALALPTHASAQPTKILAQETPALLQSFMTSNSGGREALSLVMSDCATFGQQAQDYAAGARVQVIVSLHCNEELHDLARQYPDILFIAGGAGRSNDDLPNVIEVRPPPGVPAIWQAGQSRFRLPIYTAPCGGRPEWLATQPLSTCIELPSGADQSLELEQLHYLAAIRVLDELGRSDSPPIVSSARSQLAGDTLDTFLGPLSFDGSAIATSGLATQLIWDQDARLTNPPADFSNSTGDDIMDFLRDNVGPASAAISKVCGTNCPSQCNGTCTTEGSQKCCSVASEDPQPN